jgi:hypothetical protein
VSPESHRQPIDGRTRDGALNDTPASMRHAGAMERVMGIEPTPSAWKAEVLPLNYTRDTFAIPQRNQDGDAVDWYAPRPGPVVPWSAASDTERADAQQRLLEVRTQIEDLGRQMEAEASPERQVFGRLLAQVMSFPDDDDVHLVNGQPVLTFWGFVKDRAAIGSDPLRSLDLHLAETQTTSARRSLPWWAWALLGLLLLLLLLLALFALRGCEPPSRPRRTPAGRPAARRRGN